VKKARPKATKKPVKRAPRSITRSPRSKFAAVPVTTADLRALKAELEKRLRTTTTVRVGKQRTAATKKGATGLRWNPEPEDVQKSVAQLVLTIVEFLRRLMERQAIRRMEQKTLTRKEVEPIGVALMTLEDTVRDIGHKFGLEPEDLNLDLGPLGKLM
jgi:Gas vesicle protein K